MYPCRDPLSVLAGATEIAAMTAFPLPDDLGAHVSTAGGIARAPARAAELESVVLQLFTKQPSRWAEPVVTPEIATEFRRERAAYGIRAVARLIR